jgi:hypothetical protein
VTTGTDKTGLPPPPALVSLGLMRAAFAEAGAPSLPDSALQSLCDEINDILIPVRRTNRLVQAYVAMGTTKPIIARGKGRADRQLAGLAYLLAAKLGRALVNAGAKRAGFNETGPVAMIGAQLAASILHRAPIAPAEFAAWARSGKRIALRAARQTRRG